MIRTETDSTMKIIIDLNDKLKLITDTVIHELNYLDVIYLKFKSNYD